MKTLALILFCFCSGAQAQLAMLAQQVTTTAATWVGYPTNQPGILGWWSGDNGWNASGMTWTNWSTIVTNAGKIDLTNTVAGSTPTYSANYANGHAALYFDGTDDFLKNVNYSVVSNMPHDVFLCLCLTNNPPTPSWLILDSHISSGRKAIITQTSSGNTALGIYYSQDGSERYGPSGVPPNGTPYILEARMGASPVVLRTNGVQYASISVTADNAMNGITLGSRYSPSAGRYFTGFILEFITATNLFTDAQASNITHYLYDKYALTH